MKRRILILVGVAAATVLSGCYHGDDSDGGGGDGGYAEADESAANRLPTAMPAAQEDRSIPSTSKGLSGAGGHA